VFKPGKGTITLWENNGGTRGKQIYQLKGIPLTPGKTRVRNSSNVVAAAELKRIGVMTDVPVC
jgi:hypothetical protein